MSEPNWYDGVMIGWEASDLVTLGYIKSLEEWEEFIDVLNDTCMEYFNDKEGEQDERDN